MLLLVLLVLEKPILLKEEEGGMGPADRGRSREDLGGVVGREEAGV